MADLGPLRARSVVVVAPHGDDEALGCGGTIALWRLEGIPVTLLVVSDGGGTAATLGLARDQVVELRRREAETVAGILGVSDIRFLGLPDGELNAHGAQITAAVRRSVEEAGADLVLAPSPTDYHPDHVAVAEFCFSEFAAGPFALALYEVYGTTRFNFLVEVTEVQEIKERALLAYPNSLLGQPEVFLEANRGLSRFRSFHARRLGYFEAFWHLPRYTGEDQLEVWLRDGMTARDPASVLLSKLRAADGLLEEIAILVEKVATRDREIDRLRVTLEAVTRSRGWRALDVLRGIRDRLRPRRRSGGVAG